MRPNKLRIVVAQGRDKITKVFVESQREIRLWNRVQAPEDSSRFRS